MMVWAMGCEVAPGEMILTADSDWVQCPDVYIDGELVDGDEVDTETGEPVITLQCADKLDCLDALPLLVRCHEGDYIQTYWQCVNNKCVEELIVRDCLGCEIDTDGIVQLDGCDYSTS